MHSDVETWWTRAADSYGRIPERVVVRRVSALDELGVGECTPVDSSLQELRHDDHFHPAPGTPVRSYRKRILTTDNDGGRESEFWMRMR